MTTGYIGYLPIGAKSPVNTRTWINYPIIPRWWNWYSLWSKAIKGRILRPLVLDEGNKVELFREPAWNESLLCKKIVKGNPDIVYGLLINWSLAKPKKWNKHLQREKDRLTALPPMVASLYYITLFRKPLKVHNWESSVSGAFNRIGVHMCLRETKNK